MRNCETLPRRQDVAHDGRRPRSITTATRAIRSRRSTSRSSARAATSTTKSGQPPNSKSAVPPPNAGRLSEADLPLADVGLRLHAVPRQRARHVAVRAEVVQAVPLGEGRVHQHQLRSQPAHALPARRRARRSQEGDLLRLPSQGAEGQAVDALRRLPQGRARRRASPRSSNGNDCGVCHTAVNWPTDLKFDHSARTQLPADGRARQRRLPRLPSRQGPTPTGRTCRR